MIDSAARDKSKALKQASRKYNCGKLSRVALDAGGAGYHLCGGTSRMA
jgi:hypothetical protein